MLYCSTFIIARQHADSTILMYHFCQSVQCWYCVETVVRIVVNFSHCLVGPLFQFLTPNALAKFEGSTPAVELEYTGYGKKFALFD